MAQKRILFGFRARSSWEGPLRITRVLWAVQYLSRLWDHEPGHPRGFQDTGPPLQTIGRCADTSFQQAGQALSVSALNGAVLGMGLGPLAPYFPLFPESQSNMNLPRACVSKAVTLER